jgi:NitT/TauT family transport system ATP-binding protein/nitrate/nitrite transport system substrate-binding protein
MVEALQTQRISGFCAGAPWGEMAVRAEVGITIATSGDIWRNAPEKVFALRQDWAEFHPAMLDGSVRALLRAAKFCDAHENAAYTAALLSRPDYLGVDSQAILSSLPSDAAGMNRSVFHRHAATFPWRSHAQWFLGQLQRWGLLDVRDQIRTIADRIYRPDLYRRAVAPTGESVPVGDVKTEGGHNAAWSLDASPVPIAMDADDFCDGAIFTPSD